MAVEQIVPASEGAVSNWTLGAGASKVAAVSLPDDDATSYISSGTTDETTQQFNCTPSAMQSGDTITAIKIYARVKGNTQTVAYAIGFIITEATDEYTGHGQGSVAWGTDSWEFTGLSYTYFGESVRLYIRNTQARDLLCSSLYADVTYTPAAGGGGLTKQAAYYAQARNN